MVTAQNILYSKSAIARMERIDVSDVIRLEVWHSVVFVIIRGRRPKFYSKQQFKQHFVTRRQTAARALTATQNLFNPSNFFIRNETKDTGYNVQIFVGGAICECEDFNNQKQFFGKACCKHIYAVLYKLGHGSLSDYITASSLPRAS